MPVQTFDKPSRVADRDKVLGIRPVDRLVLVRYADESGIVDERLCLVAGDVLLAYPKTTFEEPKKSMSEQTLQRLEIYDADAQPSLAGIPMHAVSQGISKDVLDAITGDKEPEEEADAK